ncbi:MAG TPA: hypothetical protein VGA73_04595 [Candidatus Binatia bacterium]
MKKQFTLGFIAFFGFVCAAVARPAGAGVLRSCDGYSALDAAARAALATGYLEGVQAALDKETRDMLVPPDDKDHPIWWVLPRGGLTPERLERSLAVFCRSKANAKRDLAGAFLQIAARKAGFPRIGMPLDDGPSETWRAVLGASRLRCSSYLAAGDAERSYLMYGYFLGTAAVRTVLKTPPELSLMVWPDADHREVMERVDAACEGDGYSRSTIRDVLWLITAEMGFEKTIARAK